MADYASTTITSTLPISYDPTWDLDISFSLAASATVSFARDDSETDETETETCYKFNSNYKYSNGNYSEMIIQEEDYCDEDEVLFQCMFVFIQDKTGNYIPVDLATKQITAGKTNYGDSIQFRISTSGFKGTITTDLRYIDFCPNGTKIYASFVKSVASVVGNNTYHKFLKNPFTESKVHIGTYSRSQNLGTPSFSSLPKFTCSKYAKVVVADPYNAYKLELYRSTNNKASWELIKTASTGSAFDAETTHSVSGIKGTYSLVFDAAGEVLGFTVDQSTLTASAYYKAVVYGEGNTTKEVISSYPMEILDITLPSTPTISNISQYTNRTPEQIVISKCTVADMSRISFTEQFTSTGLPKTSRTLTTGVTTYDVQALDANNSLETNLGNYFTVPAGNSTYRITPKLDGSTAYVSPSDNGYVQFNYKKSITTFEVIKSIEMSNQPKTISIISSPSPATIPSGSTLKFYVANNGNDTNIAWEELPDSCVGSASAPECDTYEFSNTTKTADTWKLMIKIVASKGTASSDVKLTNMIISINGGNEEVDTRPSGYKYLSKLVMDTAAANATMDMPIGYNKYKIIGNLVLSAANANPKILLNNKTTGYTTLGLQRAKGASATSVSVTHTSNQTASAFVTLTTSIGVCSRFELDLFYYNSTWYGSFHAIGNLGDYTSYGSYSVETLSNIKIATSGSSYKMQPGTEFVIMGVD